jgi:ACS family hexuronate transporter-like MFS transporter
MRSRSVIAFPCCYYIVALREDTGMTRHERLAWGIAAMLFAGSVINYLDRAVLGVVMPQIRRDLHLTNQEYGWAVNAFLTAYMVSYILGGRLADRFGCRRPVAWLAVFWSLSAMAHSLVRGLGGLAFVRAALGLGEAGFYPAAMRGVYGWFPPKDRAKAVGLFLSALSVGTLLSAPLVAWITGRFGWRAAFVAIGAIGFLLLPPWLLLHRRIGRIYGTPDPAPAAQFIGHDAPPAALGYVLRSRKFLCALAARGCSDAAWYFILFWMPGYFQEVRRMPLATVGRILWVPYLAAGIGALVGAWLSSALIHRGYTVNRGRKTVMVPAALVAGTAAAAYFVPGDLVALAIMSAALFGHTAFASNIHTAISEIAPAAHVAVLYGITGAAGTMLGSAAQLVIGPVVDAVGYRPVFMGVGLAYVLVTLLLCAMGTIEQVRAPLRSAACS